MRGAVAAQGPQVPERAKGLCTRIRYAVEPFVGAVVRGFPTRKSGAGADAGRPGHRRTCRHFPGCPRRVSRGITRHSKLPQTATLDACLGLNRIVPIAYSYGFPVPAAHFAPTKCFVICQNELVRHSDRRFRGTMADFISQPITPSIGAETTRLSTMKIGEPRAQAPTLSGGREPELGYRKPDSGGGPVRIRRPSRFCSRHRPRSSPQRILCSWS